MSTRGSICVKLRNEDLDKDLPLYDIDKNKIGTIHTSSDKPYMYVYCHHDSYEEKPGLGYNLPKELTKYEDVRDYILQGDRSAFSEPYTTRGENIEDLIPVFTNNIDGVIPEEFFYVFDDNHWKVKSYYESLKHKPFRDIK